MLNVIILTVDFPQHLPDQAMLGGSTYQGIKHVLPSIGLIAICTKGVAKGVLPVGIKAYQEANKHGRLAGNLAGEPLKQLC